MAETTEKEKREVRPAGFTDGDYIPRNEAPNMPRVFSNADMVESREPEKKMMPVSLGAMLCILSLFLGLWLGSTQTNSGEVLPEAGIVPAAGEEAASVFEARGSGAGSLSVPAEGGGCLGISVQTVSAAAAEYYRLYYAGSAVEGAQIYALEEDSAARRAGLRAGDILMALDGQAIRSAGELLDAEGRYRPGDQALCTVFRDGETAEIAVEFQERRSADTQGEIGLDW